MGRRWTEEEEGRHRRDLHALYIVQNKTIQEVGSILHIAPQTVFSRLLRLGIVTCRNKKGGFNNRRSDVTLPESHSEALAELLGVLLGDGHISHFQVIVTLGNTELAYARHVAKLIEKVFGASPKIGVRGSGHRDVYLGSTVVVKWLKNEGLVHNKVSSQVDVPRWVFSKKSYMNAFLRGFFDTDGSVYKLTYGVQISFTNKSLPLLCSLQHMLRALGYTPSAVSAWRVYLTRISEIRRFFREVKPANTKHRRRFEELLRCVGTQAVKGDWL